MRNRRYSKKAIALMVSVVLLVTVAVGATLAYLIDETQQIENEFIPSQVTVKVDETFTGTSKTNVSINNTGDTTAFIRAEVIVTWQNAEGNVYGEAPVEGVDYTAFTPADGWVAHTDGFYYWTAPVEPGENTGILIDEIKLKDGATPPADGYYLCVEIVSSGIQFDGSDPKGNKPIELAWGVDIEDGAVKAATITTE